MSDCSHDCSSCGVDCAQRTSPSSMVEAVNASSRVGKVIAVVSGKGGVGKSMVTSLLAVCANKAGKKVGVLDADITGPSIPTAFGVHGHAYGSEDGMPALETRDGIKLMSINLLLENETDPVVWRGPIVASAVKQFWTDVIWGDIDYMFVDMPPGTGDVPLTVFQSLPISGVVVVTTPQDLVGMIVEKAVNMAGMMNVPVLGIVENMAWYECPCCGQKLNVFGQSHVEQTGLKYGVGNTVSLPMDPTVAAACDNGQVEDADVSRLWDFAQRL